MPLIKVYIHFVWGTHNRIPFLNSKELRIKVWNHIKENARDKGIYIDFISGYTDHCHCLVSLGADQTIQKIIQLIKGESSFWINKNNLIDEAMSSKNKGKFEWQDEYFAVSVSESMLDKVRDYIKNQEIHHQNKTFQQECELLIDKYNFQKYKE